MRRIFTILLATALLTPLAGSAHATTPIKQAQAKAVAGAGAAKAEKIKLGTFSGLYQRTAGSNWQSTQNRAAFARIGVKRTGDRLILETSIGKTRSKQSFQVTSDVQANGRRFITYDRATAKNGFIPLNDLSAGGVLIIIDGGMRQLELSENGVGFQGEKKTPFNWNTKFQGGRFQ